MGRQSKLVLLLLLSVGICQLTLGSTPHPSIKIVHDDINELNSEEILLPETLSNGIKISTPKIKEIPSTTSKQIASSASSVAPPTAAKTSSNSEMHKDHSEWLNDLFNHTVHLMEAEKTQNSTSKTSTDIYDSYDNNYDDDYEYDEDYNYDETSSTEKTKKKADTTTAKPEKKLEIKPIKEDKKVRDIKIS